MENIKASSTLVVENIKSTSKSVKCMYLYYATTQLDITFSISSGSLDDVKLYKYINLESGQLPQSISLIQKINESDYSLDSSGKITISYANNPSLTKGYYHHYYLGPENPSSLDELFEVNGWTLCANAPKGAGATWYVLDEDSEVLSNKTFFDQKIKVECGIKRPADSGVDAMNEKMKLAELASANIVISTQDKTQRIAIDHFKTGTQSIILDVSWIERGSKATFDIEVIDTVGNIKTLSSSQVLEATRIIDPYFITNETDVTPDPLYIYTNQDDIIVTHSPAIASGEANYQYYVGYNNRMRQMVDSEVFINITDNLITTSIKWDAAKSKLLDLFESQEGQYQAYIYVGAIGEIGSFWASTRIYFTIDFNTPPVFTKKSFTLKHDFIVNRQGIETDTGTLINNSSNLDLRMFNKDEGLIFVLPQVDTPNQNNEVTEYNIYISRNIVSKNQASFVPLENVVFGQVPWLTISYDILFNGPKDEDYFYYHHKFPQYAQNEQLYFKVQAKDDKGLTTEMLTCSDYIYGCRTVAPIFSLSDVPTTRNGNTVTLDLSKFSITDLGGSATTEGWDLDFYSRYPNFERDLEEYGYTRRAQLKIELAPTQDFDSNTTITILATFVPGEEESLVNFELTSTTTDQFSSSYSKIFMRFTLTVSYGLDDNNNDNFFKGLATISSVPQIITYFGNVPTVSHRSHNVGINTNSMTDEDVLVIENYQNRKYVKLVGIGGTLNTITINLSTGEVSGMTLSGGTWDEI